MELSDPADSGEIEPGSGSGDMQELWSQVVDALAAPSGGLERSLQQLAERITQVLDAGTAIFVVGADGVLDPLGIAETDPTRLAGLRRLFSGGLPKVGEGVIGRVAELGQGTLVDSSKAVPQEDRFPAYRGYAEAWDVNSMLLEPMKFGGDVVGVLGVARHGDKPPLTAATAPIVERLADVVGRSIRVILLMEHGRLAEAALNAITDAVLAVDQDGRLTYWSDGARRLFGFDRAEVLGRPVARVIRSIETDSGEQSTGDWVERLRRQERWTSRMSQLTKSGEPIPVEVRVTAMPEVAGLEAEGGAVVVIRDIGADLQAQRDRERNERLAQAALDASPMMSAVVSDDGVIVVASEAWRSRIGQQWCEGASLWGAVAQIIRDEDAQADFRRRFQRVTSEDRPRSHGDYEVNVDGESHTFSVHTARVEGVGVAITIADITDRAMRERDLSFEASHDVLTRLPNRAVLLDRAERALNRASRHGDQVGLLFCDLDAFKALNDVHGHDTGDEVLEILAERLVESCRVTDTVVRLHGDEFAVLIEDSVSDETAQTIAGRIVTSVAKPMETTVGSVSVSTSVGVVVCRPDPGQKSGIAEVESLLRQADAAMYAAKRRGKNRWVHYDESLRVQAERADALVGELLKGVGAGEFVLHMQPQFSGTGELRGAEALLRWNHPDRGLIEPFEVFQQGWNLPMSIGDWVVKQAVATLAAWSGVLPAGFRLGVNLSRAQWLDRNTPGYVIDSLKRAEVPPERIRVEMSQTSLSADANWSVEATHRLADDGVEIAVNSFGSGVARLTDLARPKIHTVQLARKLVRESAASEQALKMVRGCTELAHSMGWQIIATGVETDSQLEAVRAVGCDVAQGFLLGRPVADHEFAERYLTAQPGGVSRPVDP